MTRLVHLSWLLPSNVRRNGREFALRMLETWRRRPRGRSTSMKRPGGTVGSAAATLLWSDGAGAMARHSNLARHRAERVDRPSKRRSEIVDAAEALFVERGIAGTSMTDVAQRVGVTRITLYRYFAGLDNLAFEVAGRMLDKLVATAREAVPAGAGPLEAARAGLASLITNFESNRDAHWYLTVLDSYRPFRDVSEELTHWYASRSRQALFFHEAIAAEFFDEETAERLLTLTNVVMATLSRYAVKSENQTIAWRAQLQHFEQLVLDYFDTTIAPQAEAPEPEAPPISRN